MSAFDFAGNIYARQAYSTYFTPHSGATTARLKSFGSPFFHPNAQSDEVSGG